MKLKLSLNKKIKISNDMKNPYTLVIGNKEMENNLVCYRKLGSQKQISMPIDEFIELLKKQIIEDKQIS